MFIPVRKDGKLFRKVGQNAYGESRFSPSGEKFGWGPVHMREISTTTEVRADKSASKSRAQIETFDYRLIVEKRVTPRNGDLILLGTGERMCVVRVQRRIDIVGRLHHWEVDCVAQ